MTTIPVGALVRDRELPELGPGRIVAELSGGASRIVFEHQDEIRDVQVSRVEVNRLPLIPGTRVDVRRGRGGSSEVEKGAVVEAELPDSAAELCDYVVKIDGEKTTVSEAEIFPQEPASTAPEDQFDALYWRGPFRFFARWGMHQMTSRMFEDAEGLPSFIGARIVPQTQQVHAARRVLWNPDSRMILADPSGADRMIEAGMVLQALSVEEPETRCLIITPGARMREWKNQMELRFGGRDYTPITRNRVENLEFAELTELFRQDRLIVSADVLADSGDARMMIGGDEWDALVVDGAHRLDPEGSAYGMAREIAERAATTMVLSPLPPVPDIEDLLPLFALSRPGEYDPTDAADLAETIEAREPVWEELRASVEARAEFDEKDSDELDDAVAEQRAASWREVCEGDDVVAELADRIEDGEPEALDEVAEHVRQFYGLSRAVVRTPRPVAADVGTTWASRELEVIGWEPAEPESDLAAHLEDIPVSEDPSPGELALWGLYRKAAASTPEILTDLITDRVEKLESRRKPRGLDEGAAERFFADPSPNGEENLWEEVLMSVPEVDGERDWLGKALRLAQQWSRDVGRVSGRFVAAGDWIEEYLEEQAEAAEVEVDEDGEPLEEQPEPSAGKVVVFSQTQQLVEQFTGHLHARLGEGVQEMFHDDLPGSMLKEAIKRFQQDPDCKVLVTDELGGVGRALDEASVLVHLDQPWSPQRLERRIERLDRAGLEEDREITSVVAQGPCAWEGALRELYADVLSIYTEPPVRTSFALPELERKVFEAWARGAEALEACKEDIAEDFDAPPSPREDAFRAAMEPHAAQLEEEAEFTELLDFVDGIDDALPVRHWARMIGIDDHRVRPGVYDFKWHWSSVRRDLVGFHVPEGDDPAEWADEETVRYLSGTFNRSKALDDETLEFFAPGHLLVDALVEDALGPTDGRATVFARRLGGNNRGKTFAVIVARADLNEDILEDADIPQGLIRRTHRRFWPETVSAKVELDLSGNRDPKVVEDGDLIRRLEDSYEGPDADQKVEYEHFIRAIGDANRFRETLREAIEVGLEDLREDRQMLVDFSADELEKEFDKEIAYFESDAAAADADGDWADRQVEIREKLVEAVRDYSLEVDAIAIVVGGTPETLL